MSSELDRTIVATPAACQACLTEPVVHSDQSDRRPRYLCNARHKTPLKCGPASQSDHPWQCRLAGNGRVHEPKHCEPSQPLGLPIRGRWLPTVRRRAGDGRVGSQAPELHVVLRCELVRDEKVLLVRTMPWAMARRSFCFTLGHGVSEEAAIGEQAWPTRTGLPSGTGNHDGE